MEMRKRTIIVMLTFIFSLVAAFSILAMSDVVNGDAIRRNPLNNDSASLQWTWLNDDHCVEFDASAESSRENLQRMFEMGLLAQWANSGNRGNGIVQQRYTYSGKWTQSTEGIWSFKFDDKTIPVGITKIDNVLYAFNGVGELKEGYEYYDGLTTGADGLVTSDDPAFWEWLGTQYLPECTSHE